MIKDDITFWIAVLGAVTGTIAFATDLLGFWRDRSRLVATATLSFGSGVVLGMNNEFFLTVNMANHGLRIVRIRRLGIAVQPLPLYWLARIRNRFGDYSARAQREIGFYDSSRAILNEVLRPPDVQCTTRENRIG